KCGSLNIIRYLARKNNYNTYNTIHTATMGGYLPIVKFLDQNGTVKHKSDLLYHAAKQNRTDMILYFGSRNYKGNSDHICQIINYRVPEAVKCMIEACNMPIDYAMIYCAVRNRDLELVEYLWTRMELGTLNKQTETLNKQLGTNNTSNNNNVDNVDNSNNDPGYLEDAMYSAVQIADYDMIEYLINNTGASYENAVMWNVESTGRSIEELDILGY